MANTKGMTRADLEAYRARWQRVNEYQTQEIRQMPVALKLRQANTLFRMAKMTRRQRSANEREIAEVRARWVKLKRLYEKSRRT